MLNVDLQKAGRIDRPSPDRASKISTGGRKFLCGRGRTPAGFLLDNSNTALHQIYNPTRRHEAASVYFDFSEICFRFDTLP